MLAQIEKLKSEEIETRDRDIEEKKARITDLEIEIQNLIDSYNETKEAKDLKITKKKAKILQLKTKVNELTSIDDEAKNKEIEAKKSRIIELEAEVVKLRSGEELVEYKQKIDALERQVAKTLGLDTEVTEGQTKVWVSPNSDDWVHNNDLKSQLIISEEPMKELLSRIRDEYNNISGSLGNIMKLQMKFLGDMDVESIDSFAIVKNISNRIQQSESPLLAEFKVFLKNSLKTYDEFLTKKQQQIPGLTEYKDLQNTLNLISDDISYEDFAAVMQEFNFRKKNFIDTIKNKTNSITDVPLKNSSINILNLLELEHSVHTLSDFITECTNFSNTNPSTSIAILIPRVGMVTDFKNLRLKTTTHYTTNAVVKGLEEKDSFKLFRQSFKDQPSRYPNVCENLIDFSEKIYLAKYLNAHWKNLQDTVFKEDLCLAIENCSLKNSESKLLLESDVKRILLNVMKKDFFETSSALTNASYLKDLNEKLNPALSYANIENWQKSTRLSLREDLIDIYTTYKEMTNLAIYINTKNPKIKEFHED